MENKVELLSPAGNKEAYFGAVHAGADAIYLGGERFSARAYADNFTTEEIIECIRYGHLHHCRTYLTVNTLVKEEELRDFISFLVPFYENGLDGVIVQDLGACRLIHRIFPDMELHISTQMTITGSYGADYVKELGAVRVVPARECSLYDIENMKKNSGLEIESFIHGAMCYCYSGQCLFSSVLGERSGNRGRCAGPCRLPYKAGDSADKGKKEYYPLSLKDMCTIEKLPKLIAGGIDSFKIEGRMKKPEYTAGVTKIYRKYIDLYYRELSEMENKGEWSEQKQKKIPFAVSKEDLDFLRQLYIRSEIQDGYYFRHNGKEMISLKEAGYKGSEQAVLDAIRQEYLTEIKRIPVKIMVEMIAGQKAMLRMSAKNQTVTIYGDVVERANQKSLSVEDIGKQFSKLGSTFFSLEDIDVYTDLCSFYPVKGMNQLRRDGVTALENLLIAGAGYECTRQNVHLEEYDHLVDVSLCTKLLAASQNSVSSLSIEIQSLEQVKALLELDEQVFSSIHRIYLSDYLIVTNREQSDTSMVCNEQQKEVRLLLQKAKKYQVESIVSLPVITPEKKWNLLMVLSELTKKQIIDGVLVKNLEQLRFFRLHEYSGFLYSDANLYLWNSASICQVLKDVNGFTYPYELSRKEERALFEKDNLQQFGEKIVYGRIPLMTTANCIWKTTDQCKGKGIHFTRLTDRMQVDFPVRANCYDCLNTIYNSVPLSLHKDMNKKYGSVLKRLIFTTETKGETMEIIRYFVSVMNNESRPIPYRQFTTAYDKDGVL